MNPEPAEATLTLLQKAAEGDASAADALFARYAPALRRWAAGRLPRWARDISDTHDLVQDAMLQTFKNLKDFEYRGPGALHGYLRHAVLNRIREEVRKGGHRPLRTVLESGLEDQGASPVEEAVGQELLERYEAALERLPIDDREAIIARVDLGLSHAEIATALAKPSADAARMAVARAMVRLAREMAERCDS